MPKSPSYMAVGTLCTAKESLIYGDGDTLHCKKSPSYMAIQPGLAGYQRTAHTNTHRPQHPSQESRGAAKTRVQAHTPTPNIPARSGGVKAERAHKHTHTPNNHPGVAGYKRGAHTNTHRPQDPSQEWRGAAETRGPSTHTHTTHPNQDWPGTSGALRQKHTDPNTPGRSGGAQPKAEPEHTHPHRTPQPAVAGYQGSAPTNAHRPQQPSQQWRGAAESRAQAHSPTPRTQARIGGVQAKRAHKHPQTPTRGPGVVGHSRPPNPSTQIRTTHLSQDWRGTSRALTQAYLHPNTPPRSGGPRTHTHTAHPSQEWRGTSGARTQTHKDSNTPARSRGAQPKPESKHKHPHRTSQLGVAGYKRRTHTSTHTPQHPARSGGAHTKPGAKHTQTPTPKPRVAGRSRDSSPSTHTHTTHPSQDWWGTSGALRQKHTDPNTPARNGGAQPKAEPEHTHPHCTPQPGVTGYQGSAQTSIHTP